MQGDWWHRAFDLALVGVVLGSLGAVFLATEWHGDAGWIVQFELRPAAELPELPRTFAALATLSARFGPFFDDHFGFRRQLVALRGAIALNLLHNSTSPLFVVGNEGWLFFTGDGSIEGYRGLSPLSPTALVEWKQRLDERHQWFAARGISYLFVVAPDKQSIYPEHMPQAIPSARGPTRLDQIASALKDDEAFLDLRPALRMHKTDGILYMAKDSHWNELGGYFAYRAIMEQLKLPFLKPRKDDFRLLPHANADLSRLIGTPAPESTMAFAPATPSCATARPAEIDPAFLDAAPNTLFLLWSAACDGARGHLLMFHDSFGGGLWAFLTQSFARTIFVLHQPTFAQLQHIAEIEHPTVVVEERVERRLGYPLRP